MKTNYSISRGLLKGLAAAVIALGFGATATAQDTYRKSWDFTKGISDVTKANLVADATNWQDSGEPSATDANDRNTITTWTNKVKFAANTPIQANGEDIAELTEITFPNQTGMNGSGDFRIGEQNPAIITALGGSAASDYGYRFRLCRANISIALPALTAGQEINIVWMSSAPSDKGGGRYISSEQCDIVSGFEAGESYKDLKVYDITYKVKETITEPTPIVFKSSNGVDIFTITIDGGDEAGGEDDMELLVVTPDPENDPIYFAIQEGYNSTMVKDLSELEEGTTLSDFDAILISNKQKDDKNGDLRKALAFYPIVNLSAELVSAWELGTVAESETGSITVAESDLENALYAELTIEDGLLELVAEGNLPVVTPGAYLAKDNVLATVNDKAYILQHNAGRNTHILIPLAEGTDTENENIQGLVRNALKIAAKSKKPITATSKPSFSAVQGNLETTVTITSAGTIFYTLGADSDPIKDGKAYTEPIKFTEATMIKAYATQDGYLPSDVASYEVAIAAQAAAPAITVTPGDNSATITITTNEEGVDLYYYFAGQVSAVNKNELTHVAKYENPIIVTEPTTVYAFATGKDVIASEVAKMNVSIPGLTAENIRLDKLSSFTAANGWASGTQYAGKNKTTGEYGFGTNKEVEAWSHYTGEILEEAVTEQAKDENGSPKFDENNEPIMEEVKPAVYKVDPNARAEWKNANEPDWVVVTEGTLLVFETTLGTDSQVTMKNDGHDCVSGKHSGYSSALDLISDAASKGAIGHKGSAKSNGKQDPNTGRIESTKAFPLPFDIVLNVKNGSSSGASNVLVSTSDDGETWSEATTVNAGDIQRQVRRTRLSIEGEGNKYVRVAFGSGSPQIHDIILYYNGAESKKYSGIEDVIATEGAEVIAVEYYNLNGVRIAEPTEGFFIKRATLSNGKVVVEKIVK